MFIIMSKTEVEKNEVLKALDLAIKGIVEWFAEKYFPEDDGTFQGDIYYADRPSGVMYNVYINDIHFTLDDIYVSLFYDIPLNVLYAWHDQWYENNKQRINLENFYKLYMRNNKSWK